MKHPPIEKLRRHRAENMQRLARAKVRHRGQGAAAQRLIESTNALLRAEVSQRRRADRAKPKPAPIDLFMESHP